MLTTERFNERCSFIVYNSKGKTAGEASIV